MTTIEIILTAWLSLLSIAVVFVYIRNGSHLNLLEAELPPECDCRGFVSKHDKEIDEISK